MAAQEEQKEIEPKVEESVEKAETEPQLLVISSPSPEEGKDNSKNSGGASLLTKLGIDKP